MISAIFLAANRLRHLRPFQLTQILGRNSATAFMLQYVVYYTIFQWLVQYTTIITPVVAGAFCLSSILGLVMIVFFLDRYKINRMWTVGLPSLRHIIWPILDRPLNKTKLIPTTKTD